MGNANLIQTLAEALDAAYVDGKPAPYRVPYHLDGDLFLFTAAKDRREAIETIRKAARIAVLRNIGMTGDDL